MSSEEAMIHLGNSINALIEDVEKLKPFTNERLWFDSDAFASVLAGVEHSLNACKNSYANYIASKPN